MLNTCGDLASAGPSLEPAVTPFKTPANGFKTAPAPVATKEIAEVNILYQFQLPLPIP